MVAPRTMKPQNAKTWAMPGMVHFSRRRWPRTSTVWASTNCCGWCSVRPGAGWPRPTMRLSSTARRRARPRMTTVRPRPITSRTVMWVTHVLRGPAAGLEAGKAQRWEWSEYYGAALGRPGEAGRDAYRTLTAWPMARERAERTVRHRVGAAYGRAL